MSNNNNNNHHAKAQSASINKNAAAKINNK